MITKKFLMLLFILSCSILTFAQAETPKSPEWNTFAPENEEFTIEVPIPLYTSKIPILTSPGLKDSLGDKGKNNESRRYLNSLNGTYFYIFSDYWDKPSQFRHVLDFVYASNQVETTQYSGELTIKKFEFSDEMDFYHTILMVNGKNRIYVFQTISPEKNNTLVKRFFGSLKFNQKPLVETFSTSKTEKKVSVTIPTSEALDTTPTVAPQIKVKTPVSGINQITPNSTTVNTPNNTAAPLKITFKPRANYTDFARFYEMSGKVVLRVVFSANGTIGTITPVSKLPFGLTEQAIAAAREIRFEPAMKAGIVISVVKPIEYIFTIY